MKASSIKSFVSCHDNQLLSDDDSIDREIMLVRREQELLRTRRARGQSRASASDGQLQKHVIAIICLGERRRQSLSECINGWCMNQCASGQAIGTSVMICWANLDLTQRPSNR